MQEFKENDTVYTSYGYGIITKTSTKRSQNSASSSEPALHDEQQQHQKQERENNNINNTNEIRQKNNDIIDEKCNIISDELCTIQLKWGGILYIEEKHLKKKVTLHIKTFYGSRNKIRAEFDILITVQQLKTILLDNYLENPKTICNLRLVYPLGTIKELNQPNNTIEQYSIPDNATLILLVQTVFSWDPALKGTDIKLSNNNLTVTKNPDADCQAVLGSISINSGRHYWEIKIDHFIDEEDLFIGIARKNIDLYTRPMETKVFWGYMCLCAKKIGPDGLIQDYGYQAKKGDVIGVLLEYKSQIATLSFYRNGTRCGVAFSNLTGSFNPIVCINYGDAQVTLDPKAPMPIS